MEEKKGWVCDKCKKELQNKKEMVFLNVCGEEIDWEEAKKNNVVINSQFCTTCYDEIF